MLAQPSTSQDKFSKKRKDRKHITTQQEWVDKIKTPAVEEEASIATQEKSSKQRPDRIDITNQQKKYKTSCGEEDSSSHQGDRSKTPTRKEEVLAQSRAKQEEFSWQCPASSSPASSRFGTRRTRAWQ